MNRVHHEATREKMQHEKKCNMEKVQHEKCATQKNAT